MSTELDRQIASRLETQGQRYTKGRQTIVSSLQQAGRPVTIPQIIEVTGLAQSSVYRNLVVLEELKVVERIVTNDDFARYELAEEFNEHHHHLICSACGDVVDFCLPESAESHLDGALHSAAESAGFVVEGHRLDLIGRCHECIAA